MTPWRNGSAVGSSPNGCSSWTLQSDNPGQVGGSNPSGVMYNFFFFFFFLPMT